MNIGKDKDNNYIMYLSYGDLDAHLKLEANLAVEDMGISGAKNSKFYVDNGNKELRASDRDNLIWIFNQQMRRWNKILSD